jgi:hypothetical protein
VEVGRGLGKANPAAGAAVVSKLQAINKKGRIRISLCRMDVPGISSFKGWAVVV